jgi:hypothetical protein
MGGASGWLLLLLLLLLLQLPLLLLLLLMLLQVLRSVCLEGPAPILDHMCGQQPPPPPPPLTARAPAPRSLQPAMSCITCHTISQRCKPVM